MPTLTERYIAATTASLPAKSQQDVRAELGVSIADAVEARIEQGEDPAAAERAVLTELGDPAVLAAGYADRPLHLIGPRYYLTWWRLLKALLIIVPLCALGGVAVAQALIGSPVETIIAESLAIALSAAVHVFFWVTLVFVILERSGTQTGGGWDVDQLPQAQDPDARLSDVVASLALLAVTAAAVLWDGTRGVAHVRGETLSFLHPQLWPWWMAALFVLFALEAVIAVTVWIRRGWTVPLAAVNTLAALLVVSWTLTLLGRGLLVNPAFTEAVLLDNGVGADVMRILGVLLGVGVTAIAGWDAASGWVKARRSTGPAR
ncbi:permease prefix domain 1-containing protein [Brachybacterium sp. p3-SID1565]|uniref:permease prefix domain 1-containing protein n=1 Tax=Brachybacterium sp. p3-SID1565 TaxID=2916046 RepID=UPI0021A64D81|nr:permease prefix domain 1-containing protein [Brachybacterium sp. p3-SID1565]MCT1384722.1 permease prefix domain 1-containing protein [Brachybacterium sp. p3-SID1565]